MGKPKPVTAAAHKLARLTYVMLTKGEAYADQGQDDHEKRCRNGRCARRLRGAAKLGVQIVPTQQPA